jgi:iron complex transport system substrate-binding protein
VLRSFTLVAGALAAALAVLASGAAGGTAAPAQFPVTITTPAGKVTVPRRPTRIVSLSPTATESLFAIGAGPQVIAVDDQSDYPSTVPKTTLSGFTPNVEAIASYRPDLVVTSYSPRGLVESLTRLRIPVIFHDAPKGFAGAYQQIRQLGMVTGREQGAARTIRRMKTRIGAIVRDARGKAGRLSVYHELTPDFFSASSSSFVGKLYVALGLRNIADEADRASAADSARRRSRRDPAGSASAPSGRARSSASTTRSRRAGGRGS